MPKAVPKEWIVKVSKGVEEIFAHKTHTNTVDYTLRRIKTEDLPDTIKEVLSRGFDITHILPEGQYRGDGSEFRGLNPAGDDRFA